LSFIEAVFLGILQGLTEFIPISSTGHLTLAGKLMNLISPAHPEQWTSFIAVIQLGTLLSVFIYFWKDIWNIISEFFRDNIMTPRELKKQGTNSRLGWMIIVGNIPIIIAGLFFKDLIEGSITKNLYVISVSLILLALLLFWAEKAADHRKSLNQITFLDSVIVGIAQVFSLIPGSSRSGTTITGGLFSGFKRETAARFSFLLGIPAILASGLLQFYESLEFINNDLLFDLIVATIMACISGYLSIDFLLRFLRKNTTLIFILYRIILGFIILIFIYFNIIQP
jgi:undecaprenyl-diphosphatase